MQKDISGKQKDWRLLEFFVPISESVNEENDFIIKGVAINETTTLNNIKYVAEELEKAASSFRNVPILLDHRNEVKNIVGRTTENVTFNHAGKRIEFEGKIMDKEIQEMIRDGRIGSVSIGAKVQDLIDEEDGSKKAIGVHGLEISLVAVPGDSQATLAQALEHNFHLKEMANIVNNENKLNTETTKMAEEEQKVVAPESEESKEESKEETKKETEEEPKEESKEEEKTEEPKKEEVSSEFANMKKQISELKELMTIKKEAVKKLDNTKGKVIEAKKEIEEIDNSIVERSKIGFALYKDYSKEGANTNLKRLIR